MWWEIISILLKLGYLFLIYIQEFSWQTYTYCTLKKFWTVTMTSDNAMEVLNAWERTMACCCPCFYVWFKEGCGSTCYLNLFFRVFLPVCCVDICHACSYIGEPAAIKSPCAVPLRCNLVETSLSDLTSQTQQISPHVFCDTKMFLH